MPFALFGEKANNTLYARMGALHHGVLCRVWGSCIHISSCGTLLCCLQVLPEVAEQHSMGSDAVPVYQLRPELRRELNCNFLYCKPQQIMSAFGTRQFQEAWVCRPMPSGDPSALAGLLTVARSPVLLG